MEGKLKVGIAVDAFYPMGDGVVEVVNKYARGLDADVTVFTVSCGDYDDSVFPYKVVRCKSGKIPFTQYRLPKPKRDKAFLKALQDADLDILHINSPFFIGKFTADFAKKNGIPVVSTFHSQYKRDFLKTTHSRLITKIALGTLMKTFNKADLCLTMNDFAKGVYEDYGGKRPVRIVPNASCVSATCTREEYAARGAKEYGGGLKLLFVGRLISDKGIFKILDALRILDKQGAEFSMVYAGSGYLEKKLNKKIKKYKLGGKVKVLGKISDKDRLMSLFAAADILVFPSVYDTDGIVKQEAANFYTPSLVVKGTGAAACITDGVNGFVAEKYDGASIAEKIKEAAADKSLIERAGAGANTTFAVTWEEVTRDLYKIYRELIAEKKNNAAENKKM